MPGRCRPKSPRRGRTAAGAALLFAASPSAVRQQAKLVCSQLSELLTGPEVALAGSPGPEGRPQRRSQGPTGLTGWADVGQGCFLPVGAALLDPDDVQVLGVVGLGRQQELVQVRGQLLQGTVCSKGLPRSQRPSLSHSPGTSMACAMHPGRRRPPSTAAGHRQARLCAPHTRCALGGEAAPPGLGCHGPGREHSAPWLDVRSLRALGGPGQEWHPLDRPGGVPGTVGPPAWAPASSLSGRENHFCFPPEPVLSGLPVTQPNPEQEVPCLLLPSARPPRPARATAVWSEGPSVTPP